MSVLDAIVRSLSHGDVPSHRPSRPSLNNSLETQTEKWNSRHSKISSTVECPTVRPRRYKQLHGRRHGTVHGGRHGIVHGQTHERHHGRRRHRSSLTHTQKQRSWLLQREKLEVRLFYRGWLSFDSCCGPKKNNSRER